MSLSNSGVINMNNDIFEQHRSTIIRETDKKKKLGDMSNDEKRNFYDAKIRRLKEQIEKAEQKRNNVGNLSEKSWTHVCCTFASTLLDRPFVADKWYQGMTAKEREKAIREYAKRIKDAAIKGGFDFPR